MSEKVMIGASTGPGLAGLKTFRELKLGNSLRR
jgi:hypothetical protein